MQIEMLKEFVVFARYLNFTRAAEELHMSQSNLSKHFKQLEVELGFPLLVRGSRKVRISEEGNAFLGELTPILENYERLLVKCRDINKSTKGTVLLQEPPFLDEACVKLYSAISEVKGYYPGLSINFNQVHKRDIFEAILGESVDLALIYTSDGVVDEPEIDAFEIIESPVFVWLDASHPLAEKERIVFADLKGVPIMQPSGAYSPIKKVINDLSHAAGFVPDFRITSFTFKIEYLYASPAEAVYIVPDVVNRDTGMQARTNMVFRRIEDASMKVMIVSRRKNDNPAVVKVRDFILEMFDRPRESLSGGIR